ncbi:MAG: tRNA uridine-5-carboxymethylaminomethyl(34) synthesis GTPase MnmE [Verrucomicrobiia bacterium]
MEDTIAAISTPIGEGGIAIIRVSGPRAFEIADAIFVSPRGKPSQFQTHTIHFGTIGNNGELLDQVMLTVMRAPRTYTAEDVVEINCHGGLLNARNILFCCLKHGARLAEPGEFTKRAFLNGRIDLTQAEAVMDLIGAKTDRAHAAAAHALEGHLSRRIEEVRERLVTVLAHIEAHIDFPEDDIATDTRDQWLTNTEEIVHVLKHLLATAREGKILREGISVAIVGRPNAGKSCLMNALLGQDRSIVTPIPGTTRDTIEETANVRGIPVLFTDTAGIRRPRGAVEGIGIKRSRKILERCELVLHVLDTSRASSRDDDELAALYGQKPVIQVHNKIDLDRKLKLPASFPRKESVEVSSVRGDGIEKLKDRIERIVWSGHVGSTRLDIAINERHADAIRRASHSLTSAIEELQKNSMPELVSQQLRIGLDAVGEIVGMTTTEDILAKIFSTFCIGK